MRISLARTGESAVLLDAEHLARWNHKVVRELKNVGIEVDNWKSRQIPSFMTFTLNESDTCYVSIHELDDMTVTVRLTAVLSSDVPETLGVYGEINKLNDSLVGARVSMRDDEVRLVVEFPCRRNHQHGGARAHVYEGIGKVQGHPRVPATLRRLAIFVSQKVEKAYEFAMCSVR